MVPRLSNLSGEVAANRKDPRRSKQCISDDTNPGEGPMHIVRSPKDFYAALIYLAFGLGGLWFGATYPMGTAGRMGAGYFPKVLSSLLVLLGIVAMFRSLRVDRPSAMPCRQRGITRSARSRWGSRSSGCALWLSWFPQ